MGHYRIFHRASGIWYIQNRQTGHQESLRTRSKHEAVRLLNARNESFYQPSAINLQLARAYINASDPKLGSRTWQDVMDQVVAMKHGETLRRWLVAINDRKLDPLRALALLETRSEHFLKVLEKGTVSTNAYLRRLHNFALAMDWLLKSVLPQRSWPKIVHKARRAITREEHERIVQRETNPERRLFYVLCWHLGGSQTDIARLNAEDVDWTDQTISYTRKKLEHRQGSEIKPPLIRISSEIAAVLRELPRHGPLFPKLRTVRPGDRATEFKQRCDGLNIRGVTLHSYRYAWAERARRSGFPLRFAEEALGHNSKAVHRAYARKAEVLIPSLDDWERQMADKTMVVNFNGGKPSDESHVDTKAWAAG